MQPAGELTAGTVVVAESPLPITERPGHLRRRQPSEEEKPMFSSIPPAFAEAPAHGPRPIAETDRITAIDALRGFALLGILLMNIVAMAMYGASYDDPTVTGGSTGANLWVWTVMHVL